MGIVATRAALGASVIAQDGAKDTAFVILQAVGSGGEKRPDVQHTRDRYTAVPPVQRKSH